MSEYLRLRLMGFSAHEILTIRAELRQLKAKLRLSQGAVTEGKASEKRNIPRYAQNKVRSYFRRRYLGGAKSFDKSLLICAYKDHPLLNGMHPDRKKIWKGFIHRSTERLEIDLNGFSFVSNPVETMGVLQEIAIAECRNANVMLNFSDDECLDIGAYLILNAMKVQMISVFHGGAISDSIRNVFILLGLDKAMQMRMRKRDPEKDNVWPLRLQQRRPPGMTKSARAQLDPTHAEKATKTLVDTVNRWLSRMAKVRLSVQGERLAAKMLGEALGNAEQHSDAKGDGNWSLAGFVSRREIETEERYVFHLALFSPGETIAESMRTCAPDTQRALNRYVGQHLRNGPYTPEMLATIFALQDGVTSDAKAFENNIGGTGLQDVLQFYAALSANADPSTAIGGMAIVSGSTCIQFKEAYVKGQLDFTDFDPGKPPPRTIWFNPENHRDTPPDLRYVHALPGKLQGTLITMAFTVDEAYLRASSNGDSND
ncbi:MAG: hypothetical protein JWP26_42 [Devosia sp.]|uniref:hypothetical protein n=1 Tax=Devosia sp. TaxID=1871048 RepID=UPI0026385BC5|nr:hypothetical protein [Devosia sp.]MDB5585072.1 hypothetical protein [Devosia sp.]